MLSKLVALSVAAVSYALVQSMVSPALSALRGHVHTTELGVSWVLTSFLLASAVLTPILGRLGDHFGKRRVLVAVMGLLAAGSVLAAVATNLPLLLAGRVLQGAGGATLPLAFGILRDQLPRERVGSAVGTVAALSAVGGAIGVLVTGPIVDHLGVPWLFWLPAIANALMAVALRFSLPSSERHTGGGLDWAAAFLLTAALVLLLLPLSLGEDWWLLGPALLAGAAWVRASCRPRWASR